MFEADYAQLALTLGRSEAACRQLASRARANVAAGRPRFALEPEAVRRIDRAFADAIATGDIDGLTRLVADDAVLVSEGGGKRNAALRPIAGRSRIKAFVTWLGRKSRLADVLLLGSIRINGRPGVVLSERGMVETVTWDVAAPGEIATIYVVRNPDKLARVPSATLVTPTGIEPVFSP